MGWGSGPGALWDGMRALVPAGSGMEVPVPGQAQQAMGWGGMARWSRCRPGRRTARRVWGALQDGLTARFWPGSWMRVPVPEARLEPSPPHTAAPGPPPAPTPSAPPAAAAAAAAPAHVWPQPAMPTARWKTSRQMGQLNCASSASAAGPAGGGGRGGPGPGAWGRCAAATSRLRNMAAAGVKGGGGGAAA